MNNLKELEKKYEELGKEIERLKNEPSDVIYLLSVEEYKQYKDKIPYFRQLWWLRSPGSLQDFAASVSSDGSVYYRGHSVHRGDVCVRPALNTSNLDSTNFKSINDDKIFHCGITWIKIDNNLYIAETPIATHRFDRESNDYTTSEIRQFLLDWYKERKCW